MIVVVARVEIGVMMEVPARRLRLNVRMGKMIAGMAVADGDAWPWCHRGI